MNNPPPPPPPPPPAPAIDSYYLQEKHIIFFASQIVPALAKRGGLRTETREKMGSSVLHALSELRAAVPAWASIPPENLTITGLLEKYIQQDRRLWSDINSPYDAVVYKWHVNKYKPAPSANKAQRKQKTDAEQAWIDAFPIWDPDEKRLVDLDNFDVEALYTDLLVDGKLPDALRFDLPDDNKVKDHMFKAGLNAVNWKLILKGEAGNVTVNDMKIIEKAALVNSVAFLRYAFQHAEGGSKTVKSIPNRSENFWPVQEKIFAHYMAMSTKREDAQGNRLELPINSTAGARLREFLDKDVKDSAIETAYQKNLDIKNPDKNKIKIQHPFVVAAAAAPAAAPPAAAAPAAAAPAAAPAANPNAMQVDQGLTLSSGFVIHTGERWGMPTDVPDDYVERRNEELKGLGDPEGDDLWDGSRLHIDITSDFDSIHPEEKSWYLGINLERLWSVSRVFKIYLDRSGSLPQPFGKGHLRAVLEELEIVAFTSRDAGTMLWCSFAEWFVAMAVNRGGPSSDRATDLLDNAIGVKDKLFLPELGPDELPHPLQFIFMTIMRRDDDRAAWLIWAGKHYDEWGRVLPTPEEMKEYMYSFKSTGDDLTALGRMQLFDHGVKFNQSYPHLKTDTLLAGLQDRVVESAQWFQMGYYGRGYANESKLETISEDHQTFSYITPMNNCSLWQYAYGLKAVNAWNAVYLPPIAARLSSELPGFNFTNDNVHGMLYALAYEGAALGSTPWSDVFLQSEVEDFQYELDLLMLYAFGYGLPYNLGPSLGSLYVKELVGRLSNATGDAKELYLEFGHDTTIDLALTALGLAKDIPISPPTGPVNATRAWYTASQVPFGAKFITERITCPSSSLAPTNATKVASESWVRFLLNDAPFPITTCGDKMNATTGACPLETFVAINQLSANMTHEMYDQVCNNTGTIKAMSG